MKLYLARAWPSDGFFVGVGNGRMPSFEIIYCVFNENWRTMEYVHGFDNLSEDEELVAVEEIFFLDSLKLIVWF